MPESIQYTKEQLEAIKHSKGHLRLLACAGSGKTEVVSRRIAELIKNGVKPKNIVAFTFTEKAADELKSRIRGILDIECPERADFGEMYVGTIHSFCFFMLQELDPKYKAYEVLDEAKRVAYIAKYRNYRRINLWPLRNYGITTKLTYYSTIDRFIYSTDIMMMEDIDPDKLKNKHFLSSYLEYVKMLEEDKYLDFSSMIYTLVKLLQQPSMLKKLHDRIKYLVVDEYQDVNRIQEKLIELIAKGAGSVCVVGDDDQCIYQWRGSFIENILGFKEKYSRDGVKVVDIPLNTNFRSTHGIIHTAEQFIRRNKKRLAIKNMTNNPELRRIFQKGDIMHKHFGTELEEYSFIVSKINELNGADFLDKKNKPFALSLGDFAILVRTNYDAARIITHLDSAGIDCVAYSGNSVFVRPEVTFAMDCIAYVFNCAGYGHGRDDPAPLLGVLKTNHGQLFPRTKFPEADSNSFEEKIKKIRSEIDRIHAKSPDDYLGELGLQAVFHKILNAMGAEEFFFGEVYNYNFAVLSQAISDYESVWIRLRSEEVRDFFHFVKAYGEGHYIEVQHQDPTLVNAVKVLTIHKAKGLEFPVVFIPGLVDKRDPKGTPSFVDESLYDFERYTGTIEDERRTLYTAMTRSEKFLFLTGSIKRPTAKGDYKQNKFIDELDKKYIISADSMKYLKSGLSARLNRTAIYPTSFSELTTYDRCPHDFLLRNVFGYNAGVPAAFGYGTNIHNILNVIHHNYIEKKRVPDNKEIENLFRLLFKLRYATPKIQENMEESAKQIVKNYVDLHHQEFKYILETEKKFEFVVDEAIISGQIDLLKKVDDSGNLTEVEIIDFKTENDKKDERIYELDHIKQLRFYAIACLKSLGLNPKKACVHHLDKRGMRKEYVDISPKHLDSTKEDIKTDVGKILTKNFPPKPSAKICGACDYKYICPMKRNRIGV